MIALQCLSLGQRVLQQHLGNCRHYLAEANSRPAGVDLTAVACCFLVGIRVTVACRCLGADSRE